MIHITLRDDKTGKSVHGKGTMVAAVYVNEEDGSFQIMSFGAPMVTATMLATACSQTLEGILEHGEDEYAAHTLDKAKPLVKKSDG